ncbi:MAG: cell division ATP-binding protein FtsE [Gammaproteobacteria bacterium]|nr:cell division ATP-binding protein FtsE [Gammaproteobacteria bacterium]
MISFEHVRKRYPSGQEALKDITFELSTGEIAFLTGHSGAGKSTLLKLVALIERPSSGKIVVGEQNLAQLGARDIPYFRRSIGIIFQSPTLLNDRSVFHNVAMPLQVCGSYSHDEIGKRVRAALDQVGLLHKENALPIALSGGEQQRVGIARAVVGKPKVLLADEPTGNLDPELSREIMDLFVRFKQVGVTTLIATHDIELINSLPYRRLIINDGVLLEHGHV